MSGEEMANLDVNEARPLTDREIVKIISGVVFGVIQAGVDPAAVLKLLRGLRLLLQGWTPVDNDRTADASWTGAIGGVIGALSGWCRTQDINAALGWICDHWDELTLVAKGVFEGLARGPRGAA
jgi:hypothetical protein